MSTLKNPTAIEGLDTNGWPRLNGVQRVRSCDIETLRGGHTAGHPGFLDPVSGHKADISKGKSRAYPHCGVGMRVRRGRSGDRLSCRPGHGDLPQSAVGQLRKALGRLATTGVETLADGDQIDLRVEHKGHRPDATPPSTPTELPSGPTCRLGLPAAKATDALARWRRLRHWNTRPHHCQPALMLKAL